MSAVDRAQVMIPFMKAKVPVVVDLDRHRAIALISRWGAGLKKKIEEACFASYQDKIESIGMSPGLPTIRRPNEVWKHLEVRHVRIDALVPDTVVVYVVPDWDLSEHIEWCIKGQNQLVYVGQFLGYSVNGYAKCSGNHAAKPKRRRRPIKRRR